MDYRQTTHRTLVGPRASAWAFVALVICSASVCAQTPQQAAPPPPSASQQAARPRTPAQENMREFRLRIRDYAKFVAQHPRIKNLSEEQREKLIQFVAGNMLFVLLHELGHAAMQEMALPILGRQEDQADNFAIINLLNIGNKVSHRVLVEAAKGWFLSDRRDRRDGEPQAYFDEHGLDQQRAYNIVCLVYGSDPANMTDLADETKLPKDRRDSFRLPEHLVILDVGARPPSPRARPTENQDRGHLWRGQRRSRRLRPGDAHDRHAQHRRRSHVRRPGVAAALRHRIADLRRNQCPLGAFDPPPDRVLRARPGFRYALPRVRACVGEGTRKTTQAKLEIIAGGLAL